MTVFAGVKIPSYADDLYEKYHIEINGIFIDSIAYGKLDNDVKYDLKLWNMFYDATKTYTGVTVTGSAGCSLVDSNLSYAIKSLAFQSYIALTMYENGGYLINNSIVWDWVGGATTTLTTTGSRGIIFPYMPEAQIKEILKFSTDIIESYNGLEQRIPMRYSPEQVFSFKYYLKTTDYDAFELIFLQQNTKFYIPIWTMSTRTADNLPYSIPQTVRCDITGRNFKVGDSILIWDSKSNYEIVTVTAVGMDDPNSDFQFAETLTGTYTKPYIIPIKQTFIEGKSKTQYAMHKVGFYEFNYKISEPCIITGYTPAYSLNSIPIIYDSNFFDSDTTQSSSQTGNKFIDFNTGIMNVKPFWTKPKEIRTFGWYKDNFTDIYQLYQLFHYLKGRQKVFYMPTFQADFELTTAYTSTDTFINVVNNGQDELFSSTGRNAITMWYNGTPYTKQITAITENVDGTLQVTIASAFGNNFPVATYGSWLVPYRLNEDTIEIKWDFTGQIYVKTSICEVNNS